ncbi:hypothetical protein Bhyg_11683 [Pseudolycoriella hygida]|uniref:Uncharacterized protein n=1 Tax=Pseudolycoriella hygida TaxID=35572 RepID=A0A9Q0MXM7_9DIPT|nr:hypothetical protein Bhyg_11683 [Pseudolycoriella hygida]
MRREHLTGCGSTEHQRSACFTAVSHTLRILYTTFKNASLHSWIVAEASPKCRSSSKGNSCQTTLNEMQRFRKNKLTTLCQMFNASYFLLCPGYNICTNTTYALLEDKRDTQPLLAY